MKEGKMVIKERIGNVALNPTIDKSRLTYELNLSDSEMAASFAKKEELHISPEKHFEKIKKYTETFKKNLKENKFKRELEALKVIFPDTFRPPYKEDWTMGRVDRLYVGTGSATSVGGVGHYRSIPGIRKLKSQLPESYHKELDDISTFWDNHDTLTKFYNELFAENNPAISKFVDVHAPTIVSARLSGTYLYFYDLIEYGVDGIIENINSKLLDSEISVDQKNFLNSAKGAMILFSETLVSQADMALKFGNENPEKKEWFKRVAKALRKVAHDKPSNYLEAIELVWIYALVAGIINYGRMDKFFGKFIRQDLENGTFTEEEILKITKSIFVQMEALRTAFNGRVIIGGKDIENDDDVKYFQRFAIRAVKENHLPEPQLTLRWSEGLDEEIFKLSLDCISTGVTFPMILNDEELIPSIAKAQNVSVNTAQNYVPFGCGEIVLEGQSIGTPNVCENILKNLNITLGRGVDPSDDVEKNMGIKFKKYEDIESYEDFYEEFLELHRRQSDRATQWQERSYEVMSNDLGFLFVSIMSKNAIKKGLPVLEGGTEHLSGSNEVYGAINAYESLYYINKLVFKDKKYSLKELHQAIRNNWKGYESLKEEIIDGSHYGNDVSEIDIFINNAHIDVTKIIQNSAKSTKTLESFGAVYINNHTNAIWGRATAASLDGRKAGDVLANGNTPQPGYDKNGPTAFLNSLAKIDTKNNFGMVHNIKFNKNMFERLEIIKALFETYFEKTGSQLMVTVASKEDLLAAYNDPSKFPNLLVRVGGFTAKFIELAKDVQIEIINRTEN